MRRQKIIIILTLGIIGKVTIIRQLKMNESKHASEVVSNRR